MYRIIQNRKIWLSLSSLLAVFSVIILLVHGLNFGLDFTGGSLLEVRYEQPRPAVAEVRSSLSDLDLGGLVVQPIDEDGLVIRFQDTTEEAYQQVLRILRGEEEPGLKEAEEAAGEAGQAESEAEVEVEDESLIGNQVENSGTVNLVEELRYESVGPAIGAELKRKSITAIFFVLFAIVAYIAWVFRKVSKPIASWKYGLTAIIALFHDVIITLGLFSLLGAYLNIEIGLPFVAAILMVLGYSVNDTIVVFDRIRENLPKSEENFENTVNASVNQAITRSINTSLTTLIVLLSIIIFGGSTVRDFVMALAVGVFIGTYSSIFLASPILVIWEKKQKRF